MANQAMLDLSAGQDDEGGEQGADGGAGVAADLEERLREAVTSAGGEAGDAGGFGMEDGGADADQRRGEEERSGMLGAMARRSRPARVKLMPMGRANRAAGGGRSEVADEGLEERGGDLVGEA